MNQGFSDLPSHDPTANVSDPVSDPGESTTRVPPSGAKRASHPDALHSTVRKTARAYADLSLAALRSGDVVASDRYAEVFDHLRAAIKAASR